MVAAGRKERGPLTVVGAVEALRGSAGRLDHDEVIVVLGAQHTEVEARTGRAGGQAGQRHREHAIEVVRVRVGRLDVDRDHLGSRVALADRRRDAWREAVVYDAF